jgi:hypothetical protein
MSYILDALKKAAEQREQQAPGMRRLVAPAPSRASARSRWAAPTAVVLSIGAVASIALAVISMRPAPIASPTAPIEAARPEPIATPARETTARAVVAGSPTERPKPAAVVAAAEARRPAAAIVTPSEPPKRVAAATTPGAAQPRPATPVEEPRSPARVEAPRASARVDAQGSLPAVANPVLPSGRRFGTMPTAPGAPRRPLGPVEVDPEAPAPVEVPVKLKLEVLVYSDVAAERMVFINGRKYKQGDTVAERARIEEIRTDSVVLSEEGRRFTLRQ